ncbi:MAG: hypothetical protein V8T86_06945 [Victivallis sp.]
MDEIVQDRAYYADSGGGLTPPGGEVFCQAEFASALIDACREYEKSGRGRNQCELAFRDGPADPGEGDLIMFDVKLFDSSAQRL